MIKLIQKYQHSGVAPSLIGAEVQKLRDTAQSKQEHKRMLEAFRVLRFLGVPNDFTTLRNIYDSVGYDDIMDGKFKYTTPDQRRKKEIDDAGGIEQYIKQGIETSRKAYEDGLKSWNLYQQGKWVPGLGEESIPANPTQLKLILNNQLKYYQSLNSNGTIKQNQQSYNKSSQKYNKDIQTNPIQNPQSSAKKFNNFNVRAFQNYVNQRNGFWKSRGYNDKIISLGKTGVDGIWGRYTAAAYNVLKNEYNQFLKSKSKSYQDFYNKYLYKSGQDNIDRGMDEFEIQRANNEIEELWEAISPNIKPIVVTSFDVSNDKLNEAQKQMRSYKTSSTPHEVTINPISELNLSKLQQFRNGGNISKYYEGGIIKAEKVQKYQLGKKIKQFASNPWITTSAFIVAPPAFKPATLPFLAYNLYNSYKKNKSQQNSGSKQVKVYSTYDLYQAIIKGNEPLRDQILSSKQIIKSGTNRFATKDELLNTINNANSKYNELQTTKQSQLSLTPTSDPWQNKYNELYTAHSQALSRLDALENAVSKQSQPTIIYKADEKPTKKVPEKETKKEAEKETEKDTETKTAPAPTYESLVEANRSAFNKGISKGYWRRQFRKNFNDAVLNNTLYNPADKTGSVVFDSGVYLGQVDESGNPIALSNKVLLDYAKDDGLLSRKEMRKVYKDYKTTGKSLMGKHARERFGLNSNKQNT